MTAATLLPQIIEASADAFIRENWRGGIGDPDVTTPELLDLVEQIWDIRGPAWQPHATLEVEDNHILWASGSGNGALLWTAIGCFGFDGGTTADIGRYATHGILQVPVGSALAFARAALAVLPA